MPSLIRQMPSRKAIVIVYNGMPDAHAAITMQDREAARLLRRLAPDLFRTLLLHLLVPDSRAIRKLCGTSSH